MILPLPIGTAVAIPGGTGNGYDLGDVVALRGGAGYAFTFINWFNLQTAGNGRRLVYKSGMFTTSTADAGGGHDDLEVEVGRATTNALITTSSNPYTVDGTWRLLVITYDESNGIEVYVGTETTLAVEATYATQTVGSGDTTSNTNAITLYYRAGTNRTIDAHFAYTHWITRRLTLAEIIQLQVRPGLAVANTQCLWHPGADGSLTTIKDYSGNGNDATQA